MKENILVVKQDEKGTYTTDYVQDVFNTSNDLNLIKSVVEKADERIYVTWASVVTRDKAGEVIPINDLIKSAKVLMDRGSPIMDSHTNAHVGKTLAYKIMQHPKTQTLGVLQLNKIFADNKKDDEVWSKIKSGEYKGTSVGGFVSGKPSYDLDNNNLLVRTLSGFNQFETSAVKEPCNPFALNESFSVVAKSIDSVESSEKMVEDTKKEETKKASVLENIMAKVSAGEELSPQEEKALSAALDAAQSAMTEEDGSEPEAEEQPEEEKETPSETPDAQDGALEAEEDKMSELEKTVTQLIERIDMIEDQLSGGVDKEEDKPMEEEEESEDKEKQVSKSEQVKKEDPAPEPEAQEQEETEATQKEDVEVVKTDRPAATQQKKVYTAYDIAMNKAKRNPITGEIESK